MTSMWTWWLTGVALFGVIPLAAHFIGWNVYNTVVWATGVAVFVYTVEASRMRAAMVRANTMQVQPLLVTRLDMAERGLKVSNIGKGAALHVTIDDIDVEVATAGDPEHFAVRFATTDVVEAGQSYAVAATFGVTRGVGFQGRTDFLPNLIPNFANRDHDVIVRYQDVEGRRYVSQMSMGKSGTRLVEVRSA